MLLVILKGNVKIEIKLWQSNFCAYCFILSISKWKSNSAKPSWVHPIFVAFLPLPMTFGGRFKQHKNEVQQPAGIQCSALKCSDWVKIDLFLKKENLYLYETLLTESTHFSVFFLFLVYFVPEVLIMLFLEKILSMQTNFWLSCALNPSWQILEESRVFLKGDVLWTNFNLIVF